MDFLVNFYQAHPGACAAFATWMLGNICAALPSPLPDSGRTYQFIFNLATIVGSALPRSVPKLRIGTTKETTGEVVSTESKEEKQP